MTGHRDVSVDTDEVDELAEKKRRINYCSRDVCLFSVGEFYFC